MTGGPATSLSLSRATAPRQWRFSRHYPQTMRRFFEIRPIAGALGAEITGIDLSVDLDTTAVAAIRRAPLDHLALFFRGQPLTPERFLAFARRFGEAVEYPFIKGIEGFPTSLGSRRRAPAVGFPLRPTSSARNSPGAFAGKPVRSPSGTIASPR